MFELFFVSLQTSMNVPWNSTTAAVTLTVLTHLGVIHAYYVKMDTRKITKLVRQVSNIFKQLMTLSIRAVAGCRKLLKTTQLLLKRLVNFYNTSGIKKSVPFSVNCK